MSPIPESEIALGVYVAAIDSGDKSHFEGAYEAEIIGADGKINGCPYRIDFKFVAVIEMREGKIARLAAKCHGQSTSFESQQFIGIAVVNRNVTLGEQVEVTQPHGVSKATVTSIPFMKRKV